MVRPRLPIQRIDDPVAVVLVDHRAAETDDLPTAGETVHQEGVQALDARHRHVHEEVVTARQDEDRQHLGQAGGVRLEALDHLPVERADLDVQERLHLPAERGEADVRVISGDHPPVTEQTHPLQAGRRRDTDGPAGLR
jgi:hypothetical protein